ncbi:hypothetical protein [Paenibacillus rhizovicinus]|uniref:hypothetical protein n=1 Tax=Paenibacillus rhizovicinus TaxID=2704463 RepID=UPI001CDD692B|nr:hypothetical protein [Paenibacillus rhizovicinus]
MLGHLFDQAQIYEIRTARYLSFAINMMNLFSLQRMAKDLAVMSIETYEKLIGKFELHKLLNEGMDAKQNQNVRPFREVLAEIEKGIPE